MREWLKSLNKNERKAIGEDVKTVQFGWPLGMPLVRKLDKELWEIRTHSDQRIARVIFAVVEDKLVLLHGFIKKSQKTPSNELKTANTRLRQLKEGE